MGRILTRPYIAVPNNKWSYGWNLVFQSTCSESCKLSWFTFTLSTSAPTKLSFNWNSIRLRVHFQCSFQLAASVKRCAMCIDCIWQGNNFVVRKWLASNFDVVLCTLTERTCLRGNARFLPDTFQLVIGVIHCDLSVHWREE